MEESKDNELYRENKIIVQMYLFLLLSYLCHNYQQQIYICKISKDWGGYMLLSHLVWEFTSNKSLEFNPFALPPHIFSSSYNQSKKYIL